MTMTLTEVEEQASLLSQEQQLQLAQDILEKQFRDVDSSWLDEAERRANEIDSGSVALNSAAEVFSAARKSLQHRR